MKDAIISEVRRHLKKTEEGLPYPRSVSRFIAEAVKNQIEKESGVISNNSSDIH